jgi:hypothetical protein
MNDTPTRRYGPDFPPELHSLDNLEVALRGLKSSLDRARPILDGLQRDHGEAVAEVVMELEGCDAQAAIKALLTLKGRLERAT